jgi:hypothetical protein
MDFNYTMIGFTELKDIKNLQKLKDLWKPIISYTPKTREEIIFSYNLWLSGLLVDNIPLTKEIIATEKNKKSQTIAQ